MSILNIIWKDLLGQICPLLGSNRVELFLVFLISAPLVVWSAGDDMLYVKFRSVKILRIMARVILFLYSFFVAIAFFLLGRISILSIPQLPGKSGIAILVLLFLALALCCSRFMVRLNQSILRLQVVLSYPPENKRHDDPQGRQIEHLTVQLGRMFVLRGGLVIAAVLTFLWQLCLDETVFQSLIQTIRSIIWVVPSWMIVLTAYLLVFILPSVRQFFLNVCGVVGVIVLVFLGTLTGVHWAWFIFPIWMTLSKTMHLLGALNYRRVETWWNEFLKQHGFVAYLANRILAREPKIDVSTRANRLEFGGRTLTYGKLSTGDLFVFYEVTGGNTDDSRNMDEYKHLIREFFEAVSIAAKSDCAPRWFRFLVIRPSSYTLPMAFEYQNRKLVSIHFHSQIQDPLLAPGEIDNSIQNMASDMKNWLISLDLGSFVPDNEDNWQVSDIPESIMRIAYEAYHARFY